MVEQLSMEPDAKDGEEENLQTAFKKLRVDADGSTVCLCEGASRTSIRATAEEIKSKGLCPSKESWHGSSRKGSRGTVRTQRRRRSKSPILHPPKFTHCSSKTSMSGTLLKHKLQIETLDGGVCLGNSAKKEPPATLEVLASGRFDERPEESAPEPSSDTDVANQNSAISLVSKSSLKPSQPSDFRLVSKSSAAKKCTCKGKECQCKNWQNMEVYSFSGLRNIISECEKSVMEDYSQSLQNRIQISSTGSSGSPRSCSEQARASVDDVTIEDLSGYMEYYFFIPKEMSYMAEMMYT